MEIIQYKQVVSSWTAHIIVCIHGSLWKPCEYTDYYHMKQWRRLMSPHRFASIAQGFVIWEHCHYPLCCVVLSSIVQYSLLHTLSCTASADVCNTHRLHQLIYRYHRHTLHPHPSQYSSALQGKAAELH